MSSKVKVAVRVRPLNKRGESPCGLELNKRSCMNVRWCALAAELDIGTNIVVDMDNNQTFLLPTRWALIEMQTARFLAPPLPTAPRSRQGLLHLTTASGL